MARDFKVEDKPLTIILNHERAKDIRAALNILNRDKMNNMRGIKKARKGLMFLLENWEVNK